MKYIVTFSDGVQIVVTTDKSLSQLALDYPTTTDILPIAETKLDLIKSAKVKKAKETVDAG